MTLVLNRAPGFRRKDSKHPYFEGYYFKFINEQKEIVILIAGISISKNEKYSFIQVASNYVKDVMLYKFPLTALKSSKDTFHFEIGNNTFNHSKVSLDLDNIGAEIIFNNNVNWNRSFMNPNIMGILSFMPKVECKHDVITINTEITGFINLPNRTVSFQKGSGYIEKNWGHSFPKKYTWLHANQFKNKHLSLQFAIAKPKWFFIRPQVYIGYIMNKKLIHFGTHRLSLVKVQSKDDITIVTINKFKYIITIKIKNKAPVQLMGPKQGQLKNKVAEYLKSDIELIVLKRDPFRKNKEIIRDTSTLSTTEMLNETQEL